MNDMNIRDEAKRQARILTQAIQAKGYKPSALHVYEDQNGNPLHWRIRCKNATGDKWIRPLALIAGKWELKEPDYPNGSPLLCLPIIARNLHSPVWITEGEQKAEALTRLGLVATTSGSASSADKADWTPLTGRSAIIWPDNDEPGVKYAQAVTARLNTLGCKVQWLNVARLPLPPKGDVMDWIKNYPTCTSADIEALPLIEPLSPQAEQARLPEAMPLQRKLAAPTPFPTDALGPFVAPLAYKIGEIIKAPAGLIGNSLLAAATLAVQPYANLIIDGRVSPLSNFFVTLGRSGERKSAVDRIALAPHRQRQNALAELYRAEFEDYKRRAAAYEAQARKITGDKKATFDEMKARLRSLGDAPLPPLQYISLIEEPTFEGMIKLLDIGQPSIGLFTDEGGRLIGGNAMNQDNALKTATGLSKLWDGATIDRVRVDGGAIALMGRRLSMHLLVQPDIGQLMLSDPMMKEQGMLSRCLVTWPDSTVGCRLYAAVDMSQEVEFTAYMARMDAILNAPYPLAAGTQNQLEPRFLPLAQDAKRLWIEFHDAVEIQQGEGGKLKPIQGFASKAAEHMGRIAGVLALLDDLDCTEIGIAHVKGAIQLTTHYINEAIRLFNAGLVEPELKLAEELLTWLKPRAESLVTLTEIYQTGPNPLRSAGTARRIVGILIEHGYLSQVAGGCEYLGKRCREAYRITEAAQ